MAATNNFRLHAERHIKRHLLADHVAVKARRRNADHGEWRSIQPNISSNYRGRERKFTTPIAIRKDHHWVRVFGGVVRPDEESSRRRSKTEHREVIPADHAAGDCFIGTGALAGIDG